MGNGGEGKKNIAEMENLSLDVSKTRFSRDLLQRFMGTSSGGGNECGEVKDEEEGELELNLGLSLGGRFGVDKSSSKLMRSSSIAACLPVVRDDTDAVAPPPVAYTSLVRTSSLPVETEEEWRKRKELQTLRRMAAKKRRSEKQRNLKAEKEGSGVSGSGSGGNLAIGEERREIEANLRGRLEKDKYLTGAKRAGTGPAAFGLSTWSAGRQGLGGGIDVGTAKGKGNYAGGSGHQFSQGSVESQGGSSSSVELEGKPLQGSTSGSELSPSSIQSLQEGSNQEVGSSGTKRREGIGRTIGSQTENSSSRTDIAGIRGRETKTGGMEDMPCVFTKGDGPNGRRVDGILYKYGKGEEVRIMCICHGNFHSPAEFVKHAGGTDVAHPLKHIVVNPNASSLL